jgi:hypothetical protein
MVPPTQVGGYRLWLLSYRSWPLTAFRWRSPDTSGGMVEQVAQCTETTRSADGQAIAGQHDGRHPTRGPGDGAAAGRSTAALALGLLRGGRTVGSAA